MYIHAYDEEGGPRAPGEAAARGERVPEHEGGPRQGAGLDGRLPQGLREGRNLDNITIIILFCNHSYTYYYHYWFTHVIITIINITRLLLLLLL